MNPVISAKNLHKNFGDTIALNHLNFDIAAGQILGLIGPNGAGKTTLLNSILGLSTAQGELQVLGMDPQKDRVALLEQVSFIADTAILPRALKVSELIAYVAGVHPRFNREKCQSFLAKTNIKAKSLVKELSKGMITQLHLALIMAIDSRLLVLDEPTLGLDILYRKQFYQSLLTDYYDAEKTIIITTHQVEEIEGVLTDLMFINRGDIVLHTSMAAIEQNFIEVNVEHSKKTEALQLQPIHLRNHLGGYHMIYENQDPANLSHLGPVHTPNLADLFVAKLQPNLTA
jgi:ABC-2 type transport system ATP-binding protein